MFPLVSAKGQCNLCGILECYNFSLDLSAGHHLSSSHPCPNLSVLLLKNLGHLPNIPSPVGYEIPRPPPFKGLLAIHIFSFHILYSHTLSLSFPECYIYAPIPNRVILLIKKITTVTFSSYSNISLGVSFVAKQSCGPLLVCFSHCNSGIDYIAQSSCCVLFFFLEAVCIHLHARRHSHHAVARL